MSMKCLWISAGRCCGETMLETTTFRTNQSLIRIQYLTTRNGESKGESVTGTRIGPSASFYEGLE